MKHLGIKRTPAYLHPSGHVRTRDILTKGHKARERRGLTEVIDGQLDAGEALFEITVDTSPGDVLDLGDLVDPAIWPRLIEEMKTWDKVEEDEFSPAPEIDF